MVGGEVEVEDEEEAARWGDPKRRLGIKLMGIRVVARQHL